MRKKNPKGLTDKQRAAEARTHYIIHHDTTEYVKCLLDSKSDTTNAVAGAHAALTLMHTNSFDNYASKPLKWVTVTGKDL